MAVWYPTLEDVLAFHEMQIRRFGGAPGIRDMGLVEMGLYRSCKTTPLLMGINAQP